MEPNQPHSRLEAAQDFEQALEQLEDILHDSSTDDEEIPDNAAGNVNAVAQGEDVNDADLAAWEDAVADIEQYLEERAGSNKEIAD
ncbi:hypothetical protein CLI64_13320 [Nostoc sp. CENA543]|uniref:hypothetical protein n=1 Tax=Nostoc sp. CENA543 TaxID=1869241 RepID=UPI000CA1F513|nr:hypothetical protein [Nostoc sp. CENA543]AUT01304.1 hypothetical protein CLI64_13320 [Nostoc sp. CENA543]